MIDTIRGFWPHQIHREGNLSGWVESRLTETVYDGVDGRPQYRPSLRLRHKATGIAIEGDHGGIRFYQASLPRLLFGHNGRLIQNRAQIDEALVRLEDLLAEVGKPLGPRGALTRVDLVWQFAGDPQLWMQAHHHARHNRIRKEALVYPGQSIHWKGSALRIRMYDKRRQMKSKQRGVALAGPEDVVRVEAELHNPILRELLADDTGQVHQLQFGPLYQVYRQLMLGFCPKPVPEMSDLSEMIALVDSTGWSYGGLSLYDIWSRGKNPQHARLMQRNIALLRPRLFNLDWAQILPVDGPSPAVELELMPLEEAA